MLFIAILVSLGSIMAAVRVVSDPKIQDWVMINVLAVAVEQLWVLALQ